MKEISMYLSIEDIGMLLNVEPISETSVVTSKAK